MRQLATVTSKRQLTIPVAIFHELGLKKGERVVVRKGRGKITIQPAKNLVEELAGSVAVPQKFKGLPIEKIIKLAKQEYFKSKK